MDRQVQEMLTGLPLYGPRGSTDQGDKAVAALDEASGPVLGCVSMRRFAPPLKSFG